jgi:hypothetical protein
VRYLIFVDFAAVFNIYDISSYSRFESKKGSDVDIKIIASQSLYDNDFIDPNRKECTNLIVVDEGRIIINCLAKD